LFWKKKKSKKSEDPFSISWDPGLRSYHRVRPAPDAPVFLKVGKEKLPIIDISAGGAALPPGRFVSGQRLSGVLLMPGDEPPIPAIFQVVHVVPGKVVATEIVKIKEEDRERLHKYVLDRQKQEIAERRRRSKKPV